MTVSHSLRLAFQRINDAFNGGKFGLTLPQTLVLRALDKEGDMDQTDLWRAAGLDRSSIGEMLVRLEVNGWVTRVPDPKDMRRKIVSITQRGRRALDFADNELEKSELAVINQIDPRDRPAFMRGLKQIADWQRGME